MKRYFDFTSAAPPPLNEARLRRLEATRQRRRYAVLLSVAALMWQVCFCLAALLILRLDFRTGAFMLACWAIGMIGSAVIAVVFFRRRKEEWK